MSQYRLLYVSVSKILKNRRKADEIVVNLSEEILTYRADAVHIMYIHFCTYNVHTRTHKRLHPCSE